MDKILKQLSPLIKIAKRYGVIIFIVVVSSIYGYIIYTSSSLVAVEPSDHQVTENYKAAKRPKLDDVISKKISELEDRNVKFQALIKDARQNPFAE